MKRLKHNSTKAEELAHLNEFVASLDNETYLKMLFTINLMLWIENRIKGDLPPDIMNKVHCYIEDLTYMETEKLELKKELMKVVAENDGLQKINRELSSKVACYWNSLTEEL